MPVSDSRSGQSPPSRSKKAVIVLVVVALSTIAIFCLLLPRLLQASRLPSNGLPSAMATFHSSIIDFSMEYPQSWNPVETPHGQHGDLAVAAVILLPGQSWPNVYVASTEAASVEEVTQWARSRSSELAGLAVLSEQAHTTPTYDGAILEYLWEAPSLLGSTTVRCEDLAIINGDRGYVVTFCAKAADWSSVGPVFNDMISSVAVG